jgi:hypothetical protein
VRLSRAATAAVAVVATALAVVAVGGASGASAGGTAVMSPTVWSAKAENLEVRIEDADCGSYDLGMIDRLQLKHYYSSEAAFYAYEPALVKPDVSVEGVYEGPVLMQSSATNGIHYIDVYCQENDVKIGEFEVTIVDGKPPKKKPKKCGDGKVLEKGKCVPKGPVKIPNPNPH